MRPRGSPSLVFSRAISIAMISETCSRDPKSGIARVCKSFELECISCFCKQLHFCCLTYTFFIAEAVQETTEAVSSGLLAEAV